MAGSGLGSHARLTGWLIPLQILLWWMLIGTLLYVGGTVMRLMPGGTYASRMYSGDAYAAWRFMIQFDLAANSLLIVSIAILLVQLYKRKRRFRAGAVVLLIAIFAVSLVALGIAYDAGELHGTTAAQLLFKVIQNGLLAVAGTLYIVRSKRVKRTFVL
ncbi:DUF2569 family protein [Paenibacillus aurantiacus]|uniref:DUF2569 family protein n=1 Tax=Paenibacillus aurantiacus TaxID=1936118 RepID=A0ABV5KZH7_9BACL